MTQLPVYTGKEEDVLSLIRADFETNAYPFFVEIEKGRVGSSVDGDYTHRIESTISGLLYIGTLKLTGYNCRWFFSTRFKYDSKSGDKSWICYAVFFQNCTAVFISHALRRFNERALENSEPSVDSVFFKYVLPQLEYVRTGIDSNKDNTLFMRVDEGAFLSYTFLNDGNYWLRTFINKDQMFGTQTKLSDALDEIRYFEMDLGINITTIFQPEVRERIRIWRLASEENYRRYSTIIAAVRFVLDTANDDLLDNEDKEFLGLVAGEQPILKMSKIQSCT